MTGIRIAVLASGSGTDLQAIIDACEAGDVEGKVAVVLSDRPEAHALERARKHGIDAHAVPPKGLTREEHEKKLMEIIDGYNVDLVFLAGYIRMLTPLFAGKYKGMCMNVHPALLPLFGGPGMYGFNVHEAVLAAGVKVSGCTVHFVDDSIDGGPIIAQTAVYLEENDTPVTLAARILAEEHFLIPKVIQLFAEGRLEIDGKRVRIKPKQ